MKRLFLLSAVTLGALFLYLGFAPVPVEPQKWDAPRSLGYVGDFVPNTRLANLETLDIGDSHGPEDVVVHNGFIYTSSQSGEIIRINQTTLSVETFAQTGGAALGMEMQNDGHLIVADAHKGLLSIAPNGIVTTLTDHVDGTPILYADDLDIAADGTIYFSDASTKFGAEASGTTLAGSLLELMEHGRTGRLLAYDPSDQTTRIVMDGLSFSNGVAIAPNGVDVLVVETGEYRVHRLSPNGSSRVIIDNLPGFPDNINRGPDGTFLIGLVSQRSDWLDQNANKPGMRKLAMRLPEFMRPSPISYGHIVQIDATGAVLQTWQDPSATYPQTTGAVIADGYMYVSSLTADSLARMPFP